MAAASLKVPEHELKMVGGTDKAAVPRKKKAKVGIFTTKLCIKLHSADERLDIDAWFAEHLALGNAENKSGSQLFIL